MWGAKGDSMTTSASMASAITARVSTRSAVATGPSPNGLGAPAAVCPLNSYSLLTSFIIVDTAVFRCCRSSMSTVMS